MLLKSTQLRPNEMVPLCLRPNRPTMVEIHYNDRQFVS